MASPPATGIITMRALAFGTTHVLPVSPERFTVQRGRNYHEVDILGLRQLGRVGLLRLDSLSWDCFFPAHPDPSYCNYDEVDSPLSWVRQVDYWLEGKVHFLITIQGTPFYKEMVLTDWSYSMEAGTEVGEIPYSMAWKEFVPVQVAVFDKPATKATRVNTSTLQPGSRYTLVSGDSLWSIAKRAYGQGSLWPLIWNANKPMRSGNPNIVFVGETITIPPGP